MNLLNEIKERLKPFKNLYDLIRIVDPINNKVINSDNEKLGLNFKHFSCYKFWGKNKKCENCISYNAYLENNAFVKLEVLDSKIFLVIASPFISNDKTYIVELLKDKIGRAHV